MTNKSAVHDITDDTEIVENKTASLLAVSLTALLATVGCTDAYIASRNLAEAAEQFEIERRIVFVNVMAE